MGFVLKHICLFVLAVLFVDSVGSVPQGRSMGRCPDGGRMYPCFMWPCWRWKCEDPQGLTCVADYCRPGCGIKWQDESGNIVHCDTPVRKRRGRG